MEEIEAYIKQHDLAKKTRKTWYVLNRYYLYTYIKKKYGKTISLTRIGEMFGGMDHASVLYGIKKHYELIEPINLIGYMSEVSETAATFPMDNLEEVDLNKIDPHNRQINVRGDSLKKLKVIKKMLGASTYDETVAKLINNTDLNHLIKF